MNEKIETLALEWANGKAVADVLLAAYRAGYDDALAGHMGALWEDE